MKKKLAMLFVVIMLLSCMPVMAVTVPAGADTAAATTGTVTTQAASTGWIKVDKYYRYYYAKGVHHQQCHILRQCQTGCKGHRRRSDPDRLQKDRQRLLLPQPCQERRPRHRIYHDRQEAVLFQPCHRQAAPHKGLVLHRLFHVLCAGGRHDCHQYHYRWT